MNELKQWMNKWMASWRPYPLVLLGYNIVRWESKEYEFYIRGYQGKMLLYENLVDKAPCHVQYDQKCGFLLEWPLCFHVWYQIMKQEEGKPGTEKVIYTRIGIARWDTDGYQLFTFYPPWTWHWD